MNKLLERTGHVITGMGLVTFALLMILIGMMVISHGLFVRIFTDVLEPAHASAAAWALALGWEFTVLITTCNVRFVNRRLPLVLAICSGVIVLFFIHAFDTTQSTTDLLTRLLVGCLITTINYVYAELFYAKWTEHNQQVGYENQVKSLAQESDKRQTEIQVAKQELQSKKSEIEMLRKQVTELEQFKANEIRKLTCSCGKQFETVYKLTSHKASCPNRKTVSRNGQPVNFVP